MYHSHRRHALGPVPLLASLALVALLAVACSNDASTRASSEEGPRPTAAPVSAPASIPAGTVLRVGDQLEYLQTVLALSDQDQDFDYEVEYSSFVGGPPMLQAFQGDALDAGFVASTPLLFAHAAGQDLAAVAGWGTEQGASGLITADPEIDGWESLAGKRVAYQRGTSAEATLLQELDAAGLSLEDVETVDVPITQVTAALKGGSADAGISTEPLISLYLAETPDGAVVAKANRITDRTTFLIAPGATLDDPGKSAALADFTTRLVKAFTDLNENSGLIAQSVYAEQYGLTPERAAAIVEENGPTSFISLPGDIQEQQQALADLFLAAGQIPAEVDVAAEFDSRFNELVQKEQGK